MEGQPAWCPMNELHATQIQEWSPGRGTVPSFVLDLKHLMDIVQFGDLDEFGRVFHKSCRPQLYRWLFQALTNQQYHDLLASQSEKLRKLVRMDRILKPERFRSKIRKPIF